MTIDERIEALEQQVNHLKAYQEVERYVGLYMTHHIRGTSDKYIHQRTAWKLFASRDDTTLEVANHGIFKGIDKVRGMFEDIFGTGTSMGVMFEHNLCSPMIEVAKDCKTARGLWMSPGHETDPRMGKVFDINAKPHPTWTWGRFAVDFIKEEDGWKIWHDHWYRLARTDFDVPWIDYEVPEAMKVGATEDPNYKGTKSSGGSSYYNVYAPGGQLEPHPDCPTAYDYWTDERLPL